MTAKSRTRFNSSDIMNAVMAGLTGHLREFSYKPFHFKNFIDSITLVIFVRFTELSSFVMTEKQTYKVAGHVFSLTLDNSALWKPLTNYSPFVYEGGEEEEFSLEIVPEVDLSGKEQLFVSEPENGEQRIDIHTLPDGYVFEMAPLGDLPICGWLKVSKDFSVGHLMTVSNKIFCINNALMLMYAFRTAGMDTIEIHASCTVNSGRAFLFLGKSGTGKSTHSSLWLKNIPGSWLLNDDNPVIRIVDGVPRVYGTPWSGKTPCYINDNYPVGAIVRINQAPKNEIHKMSVVEGFASLYSSSSGLRAIKSIADGLFATVSSVVQKVPCYLMDCLPDAEAAQVCSNEVLGNA